MKKILKICINPKIKLFIYSLIYYFFIIYILLIIKNLNENKIIIDGNQQNIDAIYAEPISLNYIGTISF